MRTRHKSVALRIFYAVPDPFPAWRLDVIELFGRQLPKLGVEVTWSQRHRTVGPGGWVTYVGRPALIARCFGTNNLVAKLATGLSQAVSDLRLFLHLIVGQKYPIVQIRDRRYFAALLALIACRIRGMKFVHWCSYPFPEFEIEMGKSTSGIRRLVWLTRGYISFHFLYRFLHRAADHIFVQSEQMRSDIAHYGVNSQKMTPVPMGVPPELVHWATRQGSIESVPGRIVYIGTLARVRHLETIIEAFSIVVAHVPYARLVMVGAGDSPTETTALIRRAEELGVKNFVTFTGFVSMEQAWVWAASATVCLSPFYPTFVLRSCSPTKLVEYLAIGKAVVANVHPEQSEILRDVGAGDCVVWAASAFAERIAELLTNSTEAIRMAERGPAWVAAHRSYDRIAKVVYEKYCELAWA